MRLVLAVLLSFAGIAAVGAAAADEVPEPTLAVLDFELIDTSLSGEMLGPSQAEQARLALVTAHLRDLLARSGRYRIVDTGPAATAALAKVRLSGCPGCDTAIARDLGADLVVTGTVHKVSNLILSIKILMRDVASGALVKGASADIRGNTDRSWTRGVSWLVRNRLLRDAQALPGGR